MDEDVIQYLKLAKSAYETAAAWVDDVIRGEESVERIAARLGACESQAQSALRTAKGLMQAQETDNG